MNPILQKQFETVKNQLASLQSILEDNAEEVAKQHSEKEELLQEKWRQRKRVTTLERIEDDYDAVEDENNKYRAERLEIRDSLTQIVQLSKALHRMQKP